MPNISWRRLFGFKEDRDRHSFSDEVSHLLPHSRAEAFESALPAKEVTRTALRLKYQIEQVVSCELEEWKITKANSPVITRKVIAAAKEAGGSDANGRACVIYCLLVCKKWFRMQALRELWDADLHQVRAVACEVLAKRLIEAEDDEEFLLRETLLKRFSVIIGGEVTHPMNVIERAVDLHALLVIGSSGYQKCVNHLWRGWLVQDENDPMKFVPFKKKAVTSYWAHFDPDRMRTPRYQNALQITISFVYLVLYTIAINTINYTGDLDLIEGILYLFTAGFVFDEVSKFWKDKNHIGFWNVFNVSLYSLLIVSFALRLVALGYKFGSDERTHFNVLSYNFLAISAPMFYTRLLLYLDTFQFFGAMLVAIKVMMKESLIFFCLLFIVGVGFLQAFVGLDHADNSKNVPSFIVQAMIKAVLQAPEFEGFDLFAPPFGIILYYIFTFIVMVVLLNILIALFNSAYENVTDNAVDEYMGLFAAKTMQFVRAPDENVFIPPFNLIEFFLLVLPLEWWMPRQQYERLNNLIMGMLYSPLLLITAYLEQREAHKVLAARRRGDEDDDRVEEWEADVDILGEEGIDVDFESDGWAKTVENSKPNVETDTAVLEIRDLKRKLDSLTKLIEDLQKSQGGSSG